MRYPQTGGNKKHSLFIPTLDGGLNLNQPDTDIADNQLVEAENLTVRYGMLQTRPGLTQVIDAPGDTTPHPVTQRIGGMFIDTTNCAYHYKPGGQAPPPGYTTGGGRLEMFVEVSENKITLLPKQYDSNLFSPPWEYPLAGDTPWEAVIVSDRTTANFIASLGEKKFVKIQNIIIEEHLAPFDDDSGWNYGGQVYTSLSGTLVMKDDVYTKYADIHIYLLDASTGIFRATYTLYPPYTDKDIYIPSVIINKNLDGTNATAWEDYNLLTRAFKEEWTPRLSVVDSGDVVYTETPGSSGGNVAVELHLGQKNLGKNEQGTRNCEIEMLGVFTVAEVPGSRPEATYNRIKFYNNWISDGPYTQSGHYEMTRGRLINLDGSSELPIGWIDVNALRAYFDATEGIIGIGLVDPNVQPFSTFYIQNITVTAYLATQSWETSRNRLLGFERSIRFGGARSGLESGTRLFMYGSKDEPNLIRWSGLSNDLYFPENNFVYVGGSGAVLAMAKQERFLAVFKATETYAIEYTYDVDEATNRTTVYFPVTPVDPGRGCDCPDSIQLIDNRLVWAHSSGEIFCMISANQYSERSIISLGTNIRPLLRSVDLTKASSADTGSRYLLMAGDNIFSWEYEHRPLYIYASLEQTQEKLVWFNWKIPIMPEEIRKNRMYYQRRSVAGYTTETYELTEAAEDTIGGAPVSIPSKFRTKKWHFGAPHLHKRVSRLFIGASGNEHLMARITCHADKQLNEGGVFTLYPDTNDTDTRLIRPRVNKTLYFGLSVESNAFIKISTITLFFDFFGGAK